jgi:outer membrane protein assembly factor BamA
MRRTTQFPRLKAGLMLGAAAAAAAIAGPARAQSFTIGKIVISGVTSVPTGPLYDSLQEKHGQKVTTDDVLADQDRLIKALEAAHITGGVKTSLSGTPTTKDIIFAVTDTGVAKPVVTTAALHLAHVTFVGNTYAKAEDLAAAAQMKPGDVVTDQSLQDALTRIGAAYKKASENAAHDPGKTNIQPQVTYPQPGQVDVVWQFTQETTAKKKKRKTEDEGFHTE